MIVVMQDFGANGRQRNTEMIDYIIYKAMRNGELINDTKMHNCR